MKRLIIVRHGQSEMNVHNHASGWTDLPLTELGKKQSICTGRSLNRILKGIQFQFYCSDLVRSYETAHIIGRIISREPVLSPEIRDIDTGIAVNVSHDDREKIQLPMTEPLIDWIPYPKAESWRMMDTRIRSFLDKIHDTECDTILIVTHANPMVTMVHWWLDLHDDDSITRIMFEADHGSITILRVDTWGCKTISKMNDTAHLAGLS